MKYLRNFKLLFTLVFTIAFIVGCNSTQEQIGNFAKNDSYFNNIFFTKWQGFAGYNITDSGNIQIGFLDFNKDYNLFSGSIKKVELLSDNKIFDIENFNIINGSEDKDYIIRTLTMEFSLMGEGKTTINKLKIFMNDGKILTWDIGDIELEVRKDINSKDLGLGVREFISSSFSRYSFELENLSNSTIDIKELLYSNLDIKFDEFETTTLNPKESKSLIYNVNSLSKIDKHTFYYFKPFLKYTSQGKESLFALDFCIYSGDFTDELVKYIVANGKCLNVENNTNSH